MAFLELVLGDTATVAGPAPEGMEDRSRAVQDFLADVAELWHRWRLVVPRPGVRVVVALDDRLDSALLAPEADVLLASTRRRRGQRAVVLMPDPYFITSRGYQALRQYVVEHDPGWAAKRDGAYWRGSTTGGADPGTNARIRFWRRHRDKADLGLTALSRPQHLGLPLVPAAPVKAHLQHRYQLDIEGHSCSWDGLYWKLLSDSTVLRVDQRDEQWYHRRMRPWVHYVPCSVRTFARRLAWCRAHPEACIRIARAATALAASLTYENELDRFARALARRVGLRPKPMFRREIRAQKMLTDAVAELRGNN